MSADELQLFSQSTAASVRDRLPDNCCLSLEDDDEETLEKILEVEQSYFVFNDHYDAETDFEEELDPQSFDHEDNVTVSDNESNNTEVLEKPCCEILGHAVLQAAKINIAELCDDDLNLLILGHLQQHRDDTNCTQRSTSHTKVTERRRAEMKYYFKGRQICQTTFLYVYGLGKKRYNNITKHFDQHGLVPRRHGNSGNIPKHAASPADEQRAISFIGNYSTANSQPLPGRMPNQRDFSVQMLPSDVTKIGVWKLYVDTCIEEGARPLGLSKFKAIWQMYLPHVTVMKVQSDLCDTCQQNNNLIIRSANCTEEEKSARLRRQEEHLRKAKDCRMEYKQQCAASTADNNGAVHFSFDYAQSLFIPHQAQQVGPMYFKTPRKVLLFGICCEMLPKQVNYLIDESQCTGKGANETVSYLHHYLENHAIANKNINFHCDNCVGQNKNNAVVQYLLWRVATGLSNRCQLSFMIVGHTRFSPDWCFGLIKILYRKSTASSMDQLGNVVVRSTTKAINQVQYIRSPESNEVQVPVCNWTGFLSRYFKPLPGITKYQHFCASGSPGTLHVKLLPGSTEECLSLLKRGAPAPRREDSPTVITPVGLSPERQWYLYDNIRQHCEEECKDVVAPKPLVPKPSSNKRPCR